MRAAPVVWRVLAGLGPVLAAVPAVPREAPPLATLRPADVANGRAIVADRRRGMCLLCHAGPFPAERFQGNLAPDLAGVGGRMTAGEIRARLIDSRQFNPESLMPAYFRAEGLTRVAPARAGKTLLSAEEIEDVTAFLATLRD